MNFLEYQKYNPEFLNNYLKYTRFIENKAQTTVNELCLDIRTFFKYILITQTSNDLIYKLSEEEFRNYSIKDFNLNSLKKITGNDIDNFIYYLRYTLNNDAKSRNRKLTSLRNLFKYLYNNNLIHHNPIQNFKSAKVEKRQPKHLNLDECKKLLSKTIQSEQRYKLRNYCILCIFLNCGIRLNELTQINLTDFKLDEMTLKVKGKGNKERMIYLNKASAEAIEEYLKIRPKLPQTNNDYNALFISSRKTRLSNRSIQNIVAQSLLLLFNENRKGFHTHTLRHTSATLLYNENDVDIMIIKEILGHSCISATEIYTHISSEKMKYIMENCTISNFINIEEENKDGNK